MPNGVATSFGVVNYSGMLFNKGNASTPFSSLIGGRAKTTNHVEFVTGQEYNVGGNGSQPAISENASLTAPDPTYVTREQKTNVTQIFQRTFGVSYGKMSNMGTLAGLNVANQQANPMSELDFQAGAKVLEVNDDIEYTFINGAYQKAANDNTANKTRGMLSAIETSVLPMGGKALGFWDVALALKAIQEQNAPIDDLILWCDGTTLFQLNADAENNGLTIVPAALDVNGIKLSSIITPLGVVYLRLGKYLPAGTAMLFNKNVIAPVMQPTPGKGNFFMEPLAKTGAGDKYQIFGQIGLDHGPEWFHAKITGISTAFEAPKSGKKIYIDTPVPTVEVDSVLESAILNKSTVAADDTATVKVETLNYDIAPGTPASVAYLWQVRAKTGTVWADLTASYTGYNTDTLTVKAADAEKHYRCKVTASGSATGTVYSNECDVEAAGD